MSRIDGSMSRAVSSGSGGGSGTVTGSNSIGISSGSGGGSGIGGTSDGSGNGGAGMRGGSNGGAIGIGIGGGIGGSGGKLGIITGGGMGFGGKTGPCGIGTGIVFVGIVSGGINVSTIGGGSIGSTVRRIRRSRISGDNSCCLRRRFRLFRNMRSPLSSGYTKTCVPIQYAAIIRTGVLIGQKG